VYPLLQANLDLLDDNFVQVLRNWATATLSTVESGKAIERLQDSNGKIGVTLSQDNSTYLELLQPENTLNFSAIPDGSTLKITGAVYPVQIHDTYAVDITLRYPYPNVDVHQLQGLNPQCCLLPSEIKASLGQTLVLFAQPEGYIQDIQTFAQESLEAILPKPEIERYLCLLRSSLVQSASTTNLQTTRSQNQRFQSVAI
jgi:hypothetical protein